MKNTLEYKILKYLKENDNGEYLDVSDLSNDKKLLRTKLSSLSMKPDRYISYDCGIDIRLGNGNDFKRECALAKIEFNGIKYLNEIENVNKNITNNFNNVGQINQDSDFSNSQNTNNINEHPKINPDQKSPFTKAWELFSSNKLILLIIGVLIEEIAWGNILKFIIKFIYH